MTSNGRGGEPIRVGLIGFGLAGATFHAPLVASNPALSLRAVVTTNADRRRAVAEQYPGTRVADSVADLLAARDVDLVIVASPNARHYEQGLAALQAGVSVVIDKPFAATAEQGRTLEREAGARRLAVIPFHNRRWDGDFLTLQRLVSDGSLGDVTRLESRFERWRLIPKPRWMQPEAPAAAEGMLYDLHTHLVDQALRLFGPVVEVYAEADKRRHAVRTDDDSFVALTHESGVRSHLKATINAADVGPRYRAYGSRGAYVKWGVDPQEELLKAGSRPGHPGWGREAPERWGTLSNGEATVAVPTANGAYEDFYAGVVRTLRDGAPPPVEAGDAIAGLEIIEAALASAATRQVVSLR